MGWSILELYGDGAAEEGVLDEREGDESKEGKRRAEGEKVVRWGGVEGERFDEACARLDRG